MTSMPAQRHRSHIGTIVSILVGIAVMVAVFVFLFPQLGTYEQALAELKSIEPLWLVVLVLTSVANILLYPFTATAAIPGLRYRHAFVDRQVGFLISNVIPGGGAITVGTEYSILSTYGVSANAAAAAVSSDAIWTYLMVLGTPALAVALLVIEGRSAAGYTAIAVVGLVLVIVSILAIGAVLRSPRTARRIGAGLQRPADRLWRLLKRRPPDTEQGLADFNLHASALVARRWKILTFTNGVAQLTPYLVLVAALAALGAIFEPLTLVEVFAAFSIALLLTSFPITPGGLGTVDAALVLLLTRFGASSSTAIAADLIWRLVWFLPQLLTGLVALGIFTWDRRRRERTA